MTKKKITKHVVGNVFSQLQKYLEKFSECERPKIKGIVFSNNGAMKRTPILDVSLNNTKDIMAYWVDEREGILEISAVEPGYEIKAPKNMNRFFSCLSSAILANDLLFLDVSHINVSQTTTFDRCFLGFGANKDSRLIGIETWDMSSAKNLEEMFCICFENSEAIALDLSSWKFNDNIYKRFWGMFEFFGKNAKEINLNLSSWNVGTSMSMACMFRYFALQATTVVLEGVEEWKVPNINCEYEQMFFNFAPLSGACLNLENWNQNEQIMGNHDNFAKHTFFRIKQPHWALT